MDQKEAVKLGANGKEKKKEKQAEDIGKGKVMEKGAGEKDKKKKKKKKAKGEAMQRHLMMKRLLSVDPRVGDITMMNIKKQMLEKET